MANIKSAIKRAKTNELSRQHNRMIKTNLKTVEKKFLNAVAQGDKEAMETCYREVSKKYDMAASKGVIHKNAANRKKSNLAKKIISA